MELNDSGEEYHYINNSHDKIFRKLLDNKQEAITIINRILNKKNKISADEIEKYNSSYISDKLKNSEADIVYKIKNQDIFFLIEHQTKIDYSMPYRILKYEVEIMDSVLIDKKYKNKNYRYPLVIPIILYTGNKEWNAKLDLRKIQLKWNEYENKELSRYNIIDVNKLNENDLLEENSVVSKMMLIEKSNTEKELELNLNKIIERKERFNYQQKEFIIMIIQLVLKNQLGKIKANEFIYKLKREEKDMLAVLEMLDRENARIRNEGKIEGKIEGKKEGKIEGKKEGIKEGEKQGKLKSKIEIAKNMIKEKFSINMISKITGLKKEEIEEIQKNIKK